MNFGFGGSGGGGQDVRKLRRAAVPNGRLFVPYTYVQTGSEDALQLDAAADWAAQEFVPEVDFEISSISLRLAAEATQGIIDIAIYGDSSGEPGSSLQALVADLDSGGGGAAWLNSDCDTNYQCQRGKKYWIVVKGEDGDDFSVSHYRWNTSLGSMFPDGSGTCMFSDDSGSTWAAQTSDSKPAILNMVINGSANNVPPLIYGRYNGQYIYLPGTGVRSIPATGVSLACDALTDDTLYYVYIYDNSGTLTLEAVSTVPTLSEGILVKTGATTHRYLGMIYMTDLIGGGDQAPVDCMDSRLVMNHYNKAPKPLGKLNPYAGVATDAPASAVEGWRGSSTEWKAEFLSDGVWPTRATTQYLVFLEDNDAVVSLIKVDSEADATAIKNTEVSGMTKNMNAEQIGASQRAVRDGVFSAGYHSMLPCTHRYTASGSATSQFMDGSLYSWASFLGTVWC